jgi:hypothetical protein
MHSSRLVSRFLALVTGVALLALVPMTAPAVATAPTAAAVRIDTDGDGLDDAVDACPTVASSNATGCPSASRGVSLSWLAGQQRLQVRVTSPVGACASRARFALWRVRPHRDYKVLGDDVSSSGRLRTKVARGATYYVTVSPSYSSGVAECGAAISRRVTVPRA